MLAMAPGLVITTICQVMMQPVAVIFGGHLGKLELDAIGLANSLINVLGTSFIMGLSTGCDTIFAQTYGSNNRAYLGIQLQRGLVIILLFLIPCYALHLNAEALLRLIGEPADVSRLVARYMLVFTPGLFAMYLFTILRRYVQCQNIVVPHIIIACVGIGVQSLFQYVFLYVLGYGLDGSALAQALAYIVMLLMTIVHLLVSGLYKGTWSGWSMEMLEDWGTFAKLSLYGMLMMCAEWWAFEITVILAGLLGTTELGAQAVVFNLDSVFYGIASGMAVATCIRVGQCMGAGEPIKAKTAARVGMCILIFCSAVVCVIFSTLRYQVPKIFTNDPDVIDLVANTLWVVCVYVFFDYISTIGRGVVRGCGQQKLGFYTVLVAYYLVALPIGIPLMFLTSLRTVGIWIGLASAITILGIFYFCYIMFLLNWDKAAVEAQKRVGAYHVITEVSDNSNTSQDDVEHSVKSNENGAIRGLVEHDIVIDSDQTVMLPGWLIARRVLTLALSFGVLGAGILARLFIELPPPPADEDYSNTTMTTTIGL